ncbi:hypothetical protein OS493_022231 [Desmophyllum pertusum]|uniref:Rho GTPase-activating protein n=1 Tax=Desmophyllum pertusum TaxID=174260 RepID=A0A9W9YAQ4_9CNID|nr:hypothetical protein OS493_022231 [Desmophyllum pertusum]
MSEAKTLTHKHGNLWGTTTLPTVSSNDLNEIEFSFDERSSGTKSAVTVHGASKMEERTQQIGQRTLTPDIVARIQAIDNEDEIATIQRDITTNTKIPHSAGNQLKAELLATGDLSSHAVEMKDGERLDESGRYILRNVVIIKHSASPLGFFIRQGDGLFKKQGIFVSRVTQGSIVEANGLLKVGDEILAVNHVDINGFNLDDVVRMIQIPRKLVLTIRRTAFLIKQSPSVEDAYDSIATKINKKSGMSKAFKIKTKDSRANDYKEPSNEGKHTLQTQTENVKVDKNVNELRDFSRSPLLSEGSTTTIEDLINAIRAQNSRSKKTIPSSEDPRNSTTPLSKQRDINKPESPLRKPSSDSIILSTRATPSIACRKSSTLTPVTSVNLIFDDPDEFTITTPATRNNMSSEDSLKVYSSGQISRSPPGSPGSSPKARRRLPSVPAGDGARTIRCNSDGSRSESGSTTASKPLLGLPAEPRSRRMLPTPPPSPVAPHKEFSNSRKASHSFTSENSADSDNPKPNRNSWSGSTDSDTMDEKSPAPSPSRKESGLSLSQIFSAFAFKTHSDGTDGAEKSKEAGERNESYKIPSSPQRPSRKSESQRDDILEQQRHSMLLHSYASGSLQPPSGPKRLTTRSSQPNLKLLMPVQEEPIKSKLSPASVPSGYYDNSKFSPKLTSRRASLQSITDKSLTNHVASQDLSDGDRLRSEAETGFLIFPDDYTGHNLLSSHAVSGMVSLHITKVTNLPFADKKLLEKKKKVYCAVEVDFERKAFTSNKRASKTLTWDELFEVEIQHGREICLSCFTSSHEFDKPVAKVSFNLSPFVRCGQQHNVVFRMQPQGAIHLKMEFIEMKTLLKRAPSDRKSGVFGFQLNVTSRNENASVPLIVRKCVEEIEKRGLMRVGLYRISGNARRKKQLHALFDEDSTSVDLSEDSYPDINVITGILKDYLRELPEPLITEALSKMLIKAAKDQVQDQDIASQKRFLSKLLIQLPQDNRETLVYLLNHFVRVINEKDTNKMDAHNLSVCFGPVLLCPPANLTESKDLLDLKLHIKIVEFLFYLWKSTGVTTG